MLSSAVEFPMNYLSDWFQFKVTFTFTRREAHSTVNPTVAQLFGFQMREDDGANEVSNGKRITNFYTQVFNYKSMNSIIHSTFFFSLFKRRSPDSIKKVTFEQLKSKMDREEARSENIDEEH